MAMTRRLWSINGLATELDTDRRTLAKRLQDLPPAETKRVGSRIEKRWHLQDVVDHLQDNHKAKRRGGTIHVDQEMIDRFNQVIVGQLLPDVINSPFFRGLILNGCKTDVGLNQDQTNEVFSFVILALCYSLEEVLQAPGIDFNIPNYAIDIMRKHGDKARASKAATDA